MNAKETEKNPTLVLRKKIYMREHFCHLERDFEL